MGGAARTAHLAGLGVTVEDVIRVVDGAVATTELHVRGHTRITEQSGQMAKTPRATLICNDSAGVHKRPTVDVNAFETLTTVPSGQRTTATVEPWNRPPTINSQNNCAALTGISLAQILLGVDQGGNGVVATCTSDSRRRRPRRHRLRCTRVIYQHRDPELARGIDLNQRPANADRDRRVDRDRTRVRERLLANLNFQVVGGRLQQGEFADGLEIEQGAIEIEQMRIAAVPASPLSEPG